MNFNPVKFLENRGEQSALKKIITEKIKSFEDNLSYAKIDWKKPLNERYMKMKENELIALRQAVGVLAQYSRDIKSNFELSNDIRQTLDEIDTLAKSVSETANPDEMKKMFKERNMERWDDKKEGPYVIEPMASGLASEMQLLWAQIHKLKSSNFSGIFSSKLKTNS